ncbi:metalloprotease TldD [Sphingomonas montana]|uniref:metalloprotease TldD n=1 Tax=Sphingomonas montana TaxID=1843236 RepID=UPI00096C6A73|nr:metalloprotease TldD [Sphingomonas montana]
MNGGTQALDLARARLWDRSELDEATVVRAIGTLASRGADLADLYFESVRSRQWNLENGQVSNGSFTIDQGVGARTSREGRVAFAYSADFRPEALLDVAAAAQSLRRDGVDSAEAGGLRLASRSSSHDLYAMIDPVEQAQAEICIALLQKVDAMARAADPRIVDVRANIGAADKVMLVVDQDAQMAADVRPVLRLFVQVIAEAKGRRAQGMDGIGGRYGIERFDDAAVGAMVANAVRQATVNLDARPAPSGVMSVVLGPGYPGVLFHEAIGHGLEGDHHRLKLSAFTGMLGKQIASKGVTVIDDGGMSERLGSVAMDDEGTPADRTVLIEDGILVGMMQDRLNAGMMNWKRTGNGRRQSYAHLPMPRMTNTYLGAGEEDPADIIASVGRGIYAPAFGGGQVDIVSGRFNFSTTEAWLIEDGKLTAPVEGATLIGIGHEALKHISRIGNDLALDAGQASCGKQGQNLSVSVGQPTLRIDEMMVGGRGE